MLSQHGNERVKCDIYIAVREAIDNRCAASYSQKSLLNKVRDTEGVKYSICTNH